MYGKDEFKEAASHVPGDYEETEEALKRRARRRCIKYVVKLVYVF